MSKQEVGVCASRILVATYNRQSVDNKIGFGLYPMVTAGNNINLSVSVNLDRC